MGKKKMKSSERRTHTVHTALTRWEAMDIRAVARSHEVSMSQYVRSLIIKDLENYEIEYPASYPYALIREKETGKKVANELSVKRVSRMMIVDVTEKIEKTAMVDGVEEVLSVDIAHRVEEVERH